MDRLLRIVRPTASDHPVAAPGADDATLVAGLRAREHWAATALIERHGNHVRRLLIRVLGTHGEEHLDTFQEVMAGAWQGIGQLHDARLLKPWLTRIAVFTARSVLRSRRRRHWLSFFDEVPEVEAAWATPELREAARAVYEIFDRIPIDERIPFALRMVDDQDLDATADACGTSVATVRRRLKKAQRRFSKLAREYDALRPWVGLP
ncbi:MAG: sigma-70 family RNA polymerase sigma factor [Pseudomonadota bacterium]